MHRRQFLCLTLQSLAYGTAYAQTHPLDAIVVYLVPLDDFPEDLAQALATGLRDDMHQSIKASLRLPKLPIKTLPGSNQLIAEDVIAEGVVASSRLPDMTAATYRLFLTSRDINFRAATLRFVFSAHNPEVNASVLSLARLYDYLGDKPVLTKQALLRLLKLSKRAIGEMRFGWKRSSNPADIMFAPLMSLADVDRMGMSHLDETPERQPEAPPAGLAPRNVT
jgi:hypothetical protein